MSWNKLIVDVDYWPSDPGSRASFCERTEVERKDLRVGEKVPYKDPSNILPNFTVEAMDDDSLTVKTPVRTARVTHGEKPTSAKLASGGRDYTNFELWIRLE